MNKREFLSEINNHVKNLPEQERASLLEYFEEMICDRMENGEREEEIIASIGTPENILAMLEEEGIFGEREDVFHKVKGKIKIDEKVKIDITPISYKAVGSIHMIRIYAENRGVDVIPVDSDQIFVDFQPMEGIDEVERYEKDGEYVFHHRMKKTFHLFQLIKNRGMGKRIMLYVPKTFSGSVIIQDENSSVRVREIHGITNLDVYTSNSSIECGDIQVNGNTKLVTSNSSITVTAWSGKELKVCSENGRIRLDWIRSDGTVMAETSNCSIEVTKIDARLVELKTSNGRICGSVVGNMEQYEITSRTGNATSNLPKNYYGMGERKLVVETSNGKIQMEFEEDPCE